MSLGASDGEAYLQTHPVYPVHPVEAQVGVPVSTVPYSQISVRTSRSTGNPCSRAFCTRA